jgi:ATP-dependent exoDNAse (exonuclease V) alpha subunit
VVGLAPSARAAAELATATGGPADTLAKWLHAHQQSPAGGARPARPPSRAADAWAGLDERTVVIVDEASMASTLDLDPLIAAAARAAAKVVLVGDPAQIGVANGPGGMLAALARAGHGIELEQIHRFSQPWERSASLALRQGQPDALSAYRTAGTERQRRQARPLPAEHARAVRQLDQYRAERDRLRADRAPDVEADEADERCVGPPGSALRPCS